VGSVSWSISGTLLKLNGTPTSGAVAQLGERLVRNEEATGSIPVSSTIVSITSGCPKPQACPNLSQTCEKRAAEFASQISPPKLTICSPCQGVPN
jgi:hypothetical protein